MKYTLLSIICLLAFMPHSIHAQGVPSLTNQIATRLSELPLNCIGQEYPNKTAHIINNETEAKLTPEELHPSFFGCFDWHSSVHGHWMLVHLLKTKPGLPNREAIVNALNKSFIKSNLEGE
jgi:hypothetical protein